jgi:hypothetical protein
VWSSSGHRSSQRGGYSECWTACSLAGTALPVRELDDSLDVQQYSPRSRANPPNAMANSNRVTLRCSTRAYEVMLLLCAAAAQGCYLRRVADGASKVATGGVTVAPSMISAHGLTDGKRSCLPRHDDRNILPIRRYAHVYPTDKMNLPLNPYPVHRIEPKQAMNVSVPIKTSKSLSFHVKHHCVACLPCKVDGLSPQERPSVMVLLSGAIAEVESHACLSIGKQFKQCWTS